MEVRSVQLLYGNFRLLSKNQQQILSSTVPRREKATLRTTRHLFWTFDSFKEIWSYVEFVTLKLKNKGAFILQCVHFLSLMMKSFIMFLQYSYCSTVYERLLLLPDIYKLQPTELHLFIAIFQKVNLINIIINVHYCEIEKLSKYHVKDNFFLY